MRNVYLLCAAIMLSMSKVLATDIPKSERILIILDASSSMQQKWNDSLTKYHAASKFILQLIDSVYSRNNTVEFGLRVFGHRYPDNSTNCDNTKLEVMFSEDNYTQIDLRLENLKQGGNASVYYALNGALEDDLSSADRYNYHIILISSGVSHCNQKICELRGKLALKGMISVCSIILGADVSTTHEYDCIAKPDYLNRYEDISNDISKLLSTCCTVPLLEKQKNYWLASNTTKAPIAFEKKSHGYIQNTQTQNVIAPKPTETPIKMQDTVIRLGQSRTSNITQIALKTGYLKIVNRIGATSIQLYFLQNGAYKFYATRPINNTNIDQRLVLEEGKYRLQCDGQTIEFTILPSMITEITI